MGEQVFGDVARLRNPSAVLQHLEKDEELVGSLERDALLKHVPKLELAARVKSEQETSNAPLHLVRVAAEEELHLLRLDKRFQQQIRAPAPTDRNERLEVGRFRQE